MASDRFTNFLSRASHIANGLAIVIGLLTLVASIAYLSVILTFGYGKDTIIYWLVYGNNFNIDQSSLPLFVICAPLGLLYIVVIRILSRKWDERFRQDIGVTAVVLVLFSLMVL